MNRNPSTGENCHEATPDDVPERPLALVDWADTRRSSRVCNCGYRLKWRGRNSSDEEEEPKHTAKSVGSRQVFGAKPWSHSALTIQCIDFIRGGYTRWFELSAWHLSLVGPSYVSSCQRWGALRVIWSTTHCKFKQTFVVERTFDW